MKINSDFSFKQLFFGLMKKFEIIKPNHYVPI